jgi:hypothetical protein
MADLGTPSTNGCFLFGASELKSGLGRQRSSVAGSEKTQRKMDGVEVIAIGLKGVTRVELPAQLLFTKTRKKTIQRRTMLLSD